MTRAHRARLLLLVGVGIKGAESRLLVAKQKSSAQSEHYGS